jgi:hypothetical protein
MELDTSSTSTMSMPSVSTFSVVMPVWGRASATMNAASASARRIHGTPRTHADVPAPAATTSCTAE